MKRTLQSQLDDDEEKAELDESSSSSSSSSSNYHEPTRKKPKRQHPQKTPIVLSNASTAQIQALECDDLLCCIMTFVDAESKIGHLPLVSKAWNRACQSPASWHSIRIAGWEQMMTSTTLGDNALCQLAPRLSRLEVLWCEDVKFHDSTLSLVIDSCGPRLRALSTECIGSQIVDTAMHTPNLRSVQIERGDSVQNMIDALCFWRQLRSIRMSCDFLIGGLHDVGSCCPLLESYYGFVDEQVLASLSSCVHLTDLDVFSGKIDVTLDMVGLLTSIGGNLVSFGVPDCDGSVVLPLVATHCKKIAKLNFLYAIDVTDALVEEVLSARGTTVVDMNLKPGCTNLSLLSVATHCPNLTALDLSFNKDVTDDGVIDLAMSCSALRQLKLGQTNTGDASLVHLVDHPALRHIVVSKWVSDKQLDAVHARRTEMGLRAVTIKTSW